MAAFRKGALFIPTYCSVRHRGKINIQKPRIDRLPRRVFQAVTQPITRPTRIEPAEICATRTEQRLQGTTEVNPYEEFLYRRCVEMFDQSKMIAICQILPVKAEELKKIRNKLKNNGMDIAFFNNPLMRRAVTDTKYENMLPLFTGKNIPVVSKDVKIKELVTVTRKIPNLIIMGVVAENRLLSRDDVLKIAKLPELAQLRGELVSLLGHGATKTHSLLGSHQQKLSVNLEEYYKQLSGEGGDGS